MSTALGLIGLIKVEPAGRLIRFTRIENASVAHLPAHLPSSSPRMSTSMHHLVAVQHL
jgi:hypothetical protein